MRRTRRTTKKATPKRRSTHPPKPRNKSERAKAREKAVRHSKSYDSAVWYEQNGNQKMADKIFKNLLKKYDVEKDKL